MDVHFKEWLIKDSNTWNPAEKRNVLALLRENPERMVQIIFDNMEGWAFSYTSATGLAVVDSSQRSDAEELMEAYRQHFATELSLGT